MLRLMIVRGGLVAVSALLLGACSGNDEAPSVGLPTAIGVTDSPRATASPYPFTDCDALRPGDPLTTTVNSCGPGEEGEARLHTVDCVSGTYYLLDRTVGQDLEGIVSARSRWRAAGAVDSMLGRTRWAFRNCLETG